MTTKRTRTPAKKRGLRAVAADEKPPEPEKKSKDEKPQTLLEAIEAGVYLDILRAQRRQMVSDLKGASGPALAAMHRQIALLSKEIAALEEEARVTAREDGEGERGDEDDSADEAFDPSAL